MNELSGESVSFPSSAPAAAVAAAYSTALKDRLSEVKNRVTVRKAVRFSVPPPSPAVAATTATTGGSGTPFEVSLPAVPSALNARAAVTFSNITSRSVSQHNDASHLEDCCHLVAEFDRRKSDLVGSMGIRIKRPVPVTAIRIIARRMAPVGNQLEMASSLFPGSSKEAVKQRVAVGTVVEEIFDKANAVAIERINRGSPLDRQQRIASGKQLSLQERQESMQRESAALSRIAVLSRLLVCDVDAMAKLQVGAQTPDFAKDIMERQFRHCFFRFSVSAFPIPSFTAPSAEQLRSQSDSKPKRPHHKLLFCRAPGFLPGKPESNQFAACLSVLR